MKVLGLRSEPGSVAVKLHSEFSSVQKLVCLTVTENAGSSSQFCVLYLAGVFPASLNVIYVKRSIVGASED